VAVLNQGLSQQRSLADLKKNTNIRETCVTISTEVAFKDLSSYTAVSLGCALFFYAQCPELVQKQYF
jgi:hypothetical protein